MLKPSFNYTPPAALTGSMRDYRYPKGADLQERVEGFFKWQNLRRQNGLWPFSRSTEESPSTVTSARDDSGGKIRGVNFASQDYLSMSSHPTIKQVAHDVIAEFGVHSAGSAALVGNTSHSVLLEQKIADFLDMPEAILFPTGWAAGFGVIKGLVRSTDHVVMDALAHTCLQEGAAAATKNIYLFRHNRVDECRKWLEKIRAKDAENGILVVTGPTGSGKTTTLATMLSILNDSTRKILTIEDPVEYEIPGVNQSQVKPAIGLTFATALRSFVRQDPDVIMVGEVRDSETAHVAIHAALTGHLVLTTLHTETAAAALPRLLDLGVEAYLLRSTLQAVIAQRLVRQLCERCKTRTTLSAADFSEDPRLAALGFRVGESLCSPCGCERCGGSGYRGRLGVFEVLELDNELRSLIGERTDGHKIDQAAINAGMTTMLDDGIAKCRAGLTSPAEILRVTTTR